jgi:hypothetical protein
MNIGAKGMSGAEFGPDDVKLLARQLTERGFYIIGRSPRAGEKPARSRTPRSRSVAKPGGGTEDADGEPSGATPRSEFGRRPL